MMTLPTLESERLTLRPFFLTDAKRVQELAGDMKIAETTANVPHPYEDGMAEAWISTHEKGFEKKESLALAMVEKKSNELIGCVALVINMSHKRAELAYWVGVPYWNQGYCTEASQILVEYGFKNLDLIKITAHHMTKNPSSGRVMEKLGMKKEGHFEKHYQRFGVFQDMIGYGLLRENFNSD